VTLNVALGAVRKGGTAAIVGVFEEPSSVHFNDLVLSERSLVGCLGYVDDFPRAIALLADGRIDAAPLITSRVGLGDAIENGFQELVRNKDEHVKILIDPTGVRVQEPADAGAASAVAS
jgi:(R,R)-butanediol dehydrogenase/meso-butanediol dehydrogenase/diacetyl reductase